MNLFKTGSFTSHSGLDLPFKIDCDAFTDEDWECIASVIGSRFAFHDVEGVPRGGLKLAEKLQKHITSAKPIGARNLLIVDDVLTTGNSMEEHRAGRDAFGVVVFARGKCPKWVVPMFVLMEEWR